MQAPSLLCGDYTKQVQSCQSSQALEVARRINIVIDMALAAAARANGEQSENTEETKE